MCSQPLRSMAHILDKFQKDGFAVIDNFLSDEEIDALKTIGIGMTDNVTNEESKIIFNTTNPSQNKESYFIESGDKVRNFYEEGALDKDGNLLVATSQSLNKVGHALHWLIPEFKKVSFGPKVEQVCRQFQLEAPVILQSMYIYKNPGVGTQVEPHQDSTFLSTDPDTLLGFWIPLDDATIENGCLWFIAGSHRGGVHRRLVRTNDPVELLQYDKSAPLYPASSFTPCPVQKGACVLIHGQVVHKSEKNKSDKSRHAYTFHVMDATSKYSPDNWLQSPKGFPLIYNY